MLQVGDKAPLFTLKNQDGQSISLKKFLGQRVIVFFYPEDDTPLCTEEVCNLRASFPAFDKKKVVVFGVSPDSVESHKRFHTKQELPFDLLSDPDHSMMLDYGIWAEKQMFGNKFMGVKRQTFLINEKGSIDHIVGKVIAKKASDQIRKVWNDL